MTQKIVNTLNIGDMLYHAKQDKVIPYPVTKIKKSDKGIEVSVNPANRKDYSFMYDDCQKTAAISTTVRFGRDSVLYVREEDAIADMWKQRRLRYAELRQAAEDALIAANTFYVDFILPGIPGG